MMTALVTGGAGFVGSHLVDALLRRGEQVVVVDDLSSGSRENLAAALDAGALLLVVNVTDADAMAGILASHSPDMVFHLAAQVDVRRSVADPVFDARINVLGTISALEAARNAGVERFVFASTGGAIYGEGAGRDLPLSEDAECSPDSPYAESKLAAEHYVSLYERTHGLKAVSLRLGNVYGPRQDPLGEAGVIAIVCGRLHRGERPIVYGDGRQTRDYIYVDDVVSALLGAADSGAGGVYNIGSGLETSVLELIEHLTRLADAGAEPEMAAARAGEIERISLDSARAREAFGWRAETALEEGLERTLATLTEAT